MISFCNGLRSPKAFQVRLSYSICMATEKQIAANRGNAKRSTGPKTAAGKLKSSRNAYRHGLSGPVLGDPAILARVHSTARDCVGEPATEDQRTSVADFFRAQIEVLRIRAIRTEQWASISQKEGEDYDPKELKRLASLDRYERYAFTKRRRAAQKLQFKQQTGVARFLPKRTQFSDPRDDRSLSG
jgi:hypothetical protein